MVQHDVEAPIEQARRRSFATIRKASLANEIGASDGHFHFSCTRRSFLICYVRTHAMSGSKKKSKN